MALMVTVTCKARAALRALRPTSIKFYITKPKQSYWCWCPSYKTTKFATIQFVKENWKPLASGEYDNYSQETPIDVAPLHNIKLNQEAYVKIKLKARSKTLIKRRVELKQMIACLLPPPNSTTPEGVRLLVLSFSSGPVISSVNGSTIPEDKEGQCFSQKNQNTFNESTKEQDSTEKEDLKNSSNDVKIKDMEKNDPSKDAATFNSLAKLKEMPLILSPRELQNSAEDENSDNMNTESDMDEEEEKCCYLDYETDDEAKVSELSSEDSSNTMQSIFDAAADEQVPPNVRTYYTSPRDTPWRQPQEQMEEQLITRNFRSRSMLGKALIVSKVLMLEITLYIVCVICVFIYDRVVENVQQYHLTRG